MSSDQHTSIDPAGPEPIRYMIRRWPAATLLGNDPSMVRMASLLVREPLSMDELADLSGQTLVRCAEFLQALHDHDVLEVNVPPIRMEEVPTQLGDLPEPSRPAPLALNATTASSAVPSQVRHPH